MKDTNVSHEQISGALINYYTPPEPKGEVVEEQQLMDLLQKLPGLSVPGQSDTLLTQIYKHHQNISLSRKNHATLSFVDDAISTLFAQTDLDFKIECHIRYLSAYLAVEAIESGPLIEVKKSHILELISLLMKECIGWSEDLGILGDQFMQKVEDQLLTLIKGRSNLKECIKQLRINFKKESNHFKKMENRLAKEELLVVAGKNARSFSARIINNEMSGQQLPLFIIFMLQGVWHEFLQNVFIRYGVRSKEWGNVTKLTEALVWSLQPRKDKKKHKSLMDNLPDQILRFCSKMDIDTAAVEQSLADVTEEYEQLRNDTPSDPCGFDLLDLDADLLAGADLDSSSQKKITSLVPGNWFLYDDVKEADEKVARLNLILNLPDENLLLFTNHNHRKAMQLTYQQMASYIDNGIIKLLNAGFTTEQTIKVLLKEVLQKVSDQNKKGRKLDKKEQRRISVQYKKDRKSAQANKLKQLKEIALLKKKRSVVLRKKAQKKLELTINAVKSLRPEAWVKLPIMEGILTPCRLVAILPGNSKYIFANRAGVKLAEYTMNQLSNLIVTENSEILDTGAEFEDVLANVVTGLRDNRNKSYEELTGETG